MTSATLFVLGLASFNCLNPGYDCKNNGLCDYFGRCKCPPGYQGYDCGLDSCKSPVFLVSESKKIIKILRPWRNEVDRHKDIVHFRDFSNGCFQHASLG